MAVSVTQLLRRQGRDVPFARIVATTPVYDPATGTYAQPTPTTATLRGVMTNFMAEEIDGSRVLDEDRKLLLDATSGAFVPQVGDIVDGTVAGNAVTGGMKIERFRPIAPNGTPTAYVCQVRG
jgi:hypothetical protein